MKKRARTIGKGALGKVTREGGGKEFRSETDLQIERTKKNGEEEG